MTALRYIFPPFTLHHYLLLAYSYHCTFFHPLRIIRSIYIFLVFYIFIYLYFIFFDFSHTVALYMSPFISSFRPLFFLYHKYIYIDLKRFFNTQNNLICRSCNFVYLSLCLCSLSLNFFSFSYSFLLSLVYYHSSPISRSFSQIHSLCFAFFNICTLTAIMV